MEVYILDSLLRRDTVVDAFESLIWTDRYSEFGDFELLLTTNQASRARFVNGVQLAMNKSNSVMTVKSVEDTADSDGRKLLKVKGDSLEAMLQDRLALDVVGGTTFTVPWTFNSTPQDIITKMMSYICYQGTVDAGDVIPFLDGNFTKTLYPASTIPMPNAEIAWAQDPSDLYSAIKDIADIYDLGFRLYRVDNRMNPGALYFNVYSGIDRTTLQTTTPAVVFSPGLENLQNTKQLSVIEGAKNVAYVYYIRDVNNVQTITRQVVYADNVDPTVAGFERKALYVEVTSVPNTVITTADITAYLIRQGKDALAKARPKSMLDGEVSQFASYQYGRDYLLGDLVTMQTEDGSANSMKVTEQVFVHDTQGERSYPTLTTRKFIDAGSWLSFKYNAPWSAMADTQFWNNQ